MIFRQRYIVTGVAIILTVLLLLISVPTIVISTPDGTPGLLVPLGRKKEFTVEYLHSVNKTPVQEHFVAAPDNQIILIGTDFRSLGVGTPFLSEEGQLVNDQGVYHLTGMKRTFDEISYVSLEFTRLALLAAGDKYYFSDYFADGTIVEIKAVRYSLIKFIYHRLQKGS